MDARNFLELPRRMYGELVRGRTRVRIVDRSTAAANGPARFLLSPYRSGTTLMRYCLDSHPDLAVPPETDFIANLAEMLSDDRAMIGLADMGFSHGDVALRVGDFARSFHDAYAASKLATQWLDKSPRYAEQPDIVPRLFPDALCLVMHRHPLDQIHSMTRGLSHSPDAYGDQLAGQSLAAAGAGYWRTVTRGLMEFCDNHPSQSHVMRYEDLCDDPEGTLRGALGHLQLEWSPEVLNYHRHDHDLGREAGRVTGTIGFRKSTGGWHKWPQDAVNDAWEVVRDVASDLGYEPPAG
ncbi:sulfotransferase [Ornithinimicrobium faecis]|uniref:Sulfotransferase n=1 Tax=Ornithinimicrobium faecis TaxID=2934158 RepID=A0ABY4YSR4_9MICO|nr:sulfotransferase [Ornithinimicrobium sp. HY1793]USQ79784.1 sulfotransferase [Ornithinimicrobium sp. HY1793]